MRGKNCLIVFVLIGCFFLSSTLVHGQVIKAIGIERDSDLEISTGINIGPAGANFFTQIQLVDEHEFEYDVWSIVRNSEVVAHAGLTSDQVASMRSIRERIRKQVTDVTFSGGLSDEAREEFQAKFLEADAEMQSLMDADQLTRFNEARRQLKIEKVGLEQFLTSESLDLTDLEIDGVRKIASEIATREKDNPVNLFRDFNLKLLECLADEDRERVASLLDESAQQSFVNVRLFNSKAPRSKPKPLTSPDYLRTIIRSVSIRRELKISESQLEEIKELKAKRDAETDPSLKQSITAELDKILTAEQTRLLSAASIQNEAQRFGTIKAVCAGTLARELELSERETERLFEIGVELQQELIEKMRDKKANRWHEAMSTLDSNLQDKVIKLLGTPMVMGVQ
ncbi:MAG: hypothetical protein ACI87E_001923 [Mariniblastus sp.]